MANTHIKKSSLVIREMQSNPQWGVISLQWEWLLSKSQNNTCCQGCGEKGTLIQYWWECKSIYPSWETVGSSIKKLKIRLAYDPATPLLGTHPKNVKSAGEWDTCTLLFTAAQFTTAKTRNQSNCSSGISLTVHQWATGQRTWHRYMVEYYSAIKNQILTFATMEFMTLCETSQTEKDELHTLSFICRIMCVCLL